MAVSSSEAEFVAISDVCKDLVFAIKVIEFMGVKIRLPVTVMVDNKGAIFMADNKVVKRTRHIHTRYLLIREYIEDGIIKIQFVKSEDNMADIMTKNVDSKTYKNHQNNLVKE